MIGQVRECHEPCGYVTLLSDWLKPISDCSACCAGRLSASQARKQISGNLALCLPQLMIDFCQSPGSWFGVDPFCQILPSRCCESGYAVDDAQGVQNPCAIRFWVLLRLTPKSGVASFDVRL